MVFGTSCASSGTSATSNDGRLSTRIWPWRSRIVPRVARTRFRRMRLFSESDLYCSPSLTCRCQRRTSVSPKSTSAAATVRTRRRRSVAGTSRRLVTRDVISCRAEDALLPPNHPEDERCDRGRKERLGEQHLDRAEREPFDRQIRRQGAEDREALHDRSEEDHRDARERVVHPESP